VWLLDELLLWASTAEVVRHRCSLTVRE
jgi:hypothetical protein